MTIIFSYQRPDMLSRLLDEVTGIVIDDGSEYDYSPFIKRCDYHRLPHGGKELFWNTWNYALDLCKESVANFFLFLPDDVYDVDLKTIHKLHESLKSEPYAFNYLNVGHTTGWTPIKPKSVDIDGFSAIECGFVDCGFFCNREALELLGFELERIPMNRFKSDKISSGVGHQMSRRLWKKGVKMYIPEKSLAYHGDHESQMHKEERKNNPLISI